VNPAASIGVLAALGAALLSSALGLGIVIAQASSGAIGLDDAGAVAFPPLGAIPFSTVGAFVLLRRPRNVIGGLMLLAGTLMSLAFATDMYVRLDASTAEPLPGADAAAWFSDTAWISITMLVIPRLLLLFPDGHLPSRRWTIIGGLQAVLAVAIVLVAFTPGPLPDYGYDNPFGFEALAGVGALLEVNRTIVFVLMFVILVASCLSLVARFRYATGVERRQLKWIAWIVLVVALTETVGIALQPLWPDAGLAASGVAIVALIALPVAIGIAVLRYRLYEIDRIISRTIGWALVSGVLLAIFGGLVLGLSALLQTVTGGSTLAIAASTLAVAALFNPIRYRIQAVVDHRFNRARYDAGVVASHFANQVREEVDVGAVMEAFDDAVRRTVHPASSVVWIRR
jgi:hypothetical protein